MLVDLQEAGGGARQGLLEEVLRGVIMLRQWMIRISIIYRHCIVIGTIKMIIVVITMIIILIVRALRCVFTTVDDS